MISFSKAVKNDIKYIDRDICDLIADGSIDLANAHSKRFDRVVELLEEAYIDRDNARECHRLANKENARDQDQIDQQRAIIKALCFANFLLLIAASFTTFKLLY